MLRIKEINKIHTHIEAFFYGLKILMVLDLLIVEVS
jgi:hypothetical protein